MKRLQDIPTHSNCPVKQRSVAEYSLLQVELETESPISHIHEKSLIVLIVGPHSIALCVDANSKMERKKEHEDVVVLQVR